METDLYIQFLINKRVNKKGENMKLYIERGHDGEDDFDYFELEKKINEED